jgi:PTH1 family peptidyl-tRNA hydrolase
MDAVFVGLGNHGSKYKNNRHNAGFRAVDSFVEDNSASFKNMRLIVEATQFCVGEKKIIVAKPLTFMNLSGNAVRFLVDFFKIPLEMLYVFHDDIDLEFGRVKIKKGGGSGGHNGLKSIDSVIGNDYWRIRIGVGRPNEKFEVSSYVLSDFSEDEESILQNILSEMNKNIPLLFSDHKLLESKLNQKS